MHTRVYQRTNENAFWPSGCSIFSCWDGEAWIVAGICLVPIIVAVCSTKCHLVSIIRTVIRTVIRTACCLCSWGIQDQSKQLWPKPQIRSLSLTHSSSAGTWGFPRRSVSRNCCSPRPLSMYAHMSVLWWSRCPPPDSFLKKMTSYRKDVFFTSGSWTLFFGYMVFSVISNKNSGTGI